MREATSRTRRVGNPERHPRALRLSGALPAALVLILGAEAVATALPIGAPSAQALSPGIISVSPERVTPTAQVLPGSVRLRLPLPLKETPGPVAPAPAPATPSAMSATVRIDVEISDQTAPIVTIRPGPAGTKGAGARLTAYASDDIDVVGVAFYRGDTRLAVATSGRDGEWTAELTPAEIAHLSSRGEGAKTGPVYALAVDAAGNVGRSGHAHVSAAE